MRQAGKPGTRRLNPARLSRSPARGDVVVLNAVRAAISRSVVWEALCC